MKVTGCTVHFVDEELDHGAIVVQRAIPVLETDDAHSLAERILVEEHIAYTEAIARVASGEYEVRGRKFVKRDHATISGSPNKREPLASESQVERRQQGVLFLFRWSAGNRRLLGFAEIQRAG